MELLHDARKARKIQLLQHCQSEVLVLTSQTLLEAWSPELAEELENCANRGVRVRLLLDKGGASPSPRISRLLLAGAEFRQGGRHYPWTRRAPVEGEIWTLDRKDAIAVNERLGASHKPHSMVVECLMGEDVAIGAASYFDNRWESSANSTAFSVRHKSYALHSGRQGSNEFFGCLIGAQREIIISLPGGRLAKKVEAALHSALASGLQVTLYVNAEREDAPALKRLRRLAMAGAVLKICGRRLSSECAVVDGQCLYMGSLPSSWEALAPPTSPVFVLRSKAVSAEILEALEGQVSVEITTAPQPGSYAFR
jgi:phosphatidylserine/phosphatidylglycerophosphate/cardiolipin synthase-like enzyme